MYLLRRCAVKNNFPAQNVATSKLIKKYSEKVDASRSAAAHAVHGDEDQEFRVLDLKKRKTQQMQRRQAGARSTNPPTLPPRSDRMPVDQDWVSVWPGPRTFHPASVPLPLRQGVPVKEGGAPPGKFVNAELMKIPNFLHLTPPAIQRHCEVLKKFCTPWPQGLETLEDMQYHFPLEIITSDYCHSSPSIRDPLARIVTIKVKFSSLVFDSHAKDKFLRLVGERFDPETDYVTILTDRCPLRKQNLDYAHFLLAALYHESWKTEAWELEKGEPDMEFYEWEKSPSYAAVGVLSQKIPDLDQEVAAMYGKAVTNLIDQGESTETLAKYKELTKKMLSLPHEALDQTTLQ